MGFDMRMRLNFFGGALGDPVGEGKSRQAPSKLQRAVEIIVAKYVWQARSLAQFRFKSVVQLTTRLMVAGVPSPGVTMRKRLPSGVTS